MKYYPFGETRYTWGSTPTDRRFTGQRQEDSAALGSLYDYGARFYSPAVGRFISADTVVPDPNDPQHLNRFSYTANNPLKYTDPSGHMLTACAEGCSTPAFDPLQTKALAEQKYYGYYLPCQQHGGPGCSATATAIMNAKDFVEGAGKTIDHLTNSGSGVQFSACGGGDIGLGGEGCGSVTLLLNLRAGQFGIFWSGSLAGKVGIPNGLSGNVSIGLAIAPGVSDLNYLRGPAEVRGGDVNFDPLFVKGGLYGQGSTSLEPYDSNGDGKADTFRPRIDDKTGAPVTILSAGVQAGANQISTIVDGGVKLGSSNTGGCVFSMSPLSLTCR